MRILVADDNADFCKGLVDLLTMEGHQATAATNGPEALALLRAHPDADGIILDLRMPGMSGLAVLREVRKDHPTLPVVLGTGYVDAEDVSDAYSRVLVKPFTPAAALDVIREMGGH